MPKKGLDPRAFSGTNLKAVNRVTFYPDDHTVAFGAPSKTGLRRLNMAVGRYDDKLAGVQLEHVEFLVRMLEAMSGKRFEKEETGNDTAFPTVYFNKTNVRYRA